MRKRLAFLSMAAAAALLAAGIVATRADSNGTITLPPANTKLYDGPNVALAQSRCLVCHSADYIYMQPPLTRKQWTAEVTKMQKTFGAPITDADVAPLVDYLMSQDGKPG